MHGVVEELTDYIEEQLFCKTILCTNLTDIVLLP